LRSQLEVAANRKTSKDQLTNELQAIAEETIDSDPDGCEGTDTSVQIATQRVEIELTLNRRFDTFTPDDQECLLNAITEILQMDGQPNVKGIEPGSVKVTLELDRDMAERLLWAVKEGKLSRFGSVDATIVESRPLDAQIDRIETETGANSGDYHSGDSLWFPQRTDRTPPLVTEIAATIGSSMTVMEISERVITECIKRFDAEQGSVHLLGKGESDVATPYVHVGQSGPAGIRYQLGQHLIQWSPHRVPLNQCSLCRLCTKRRSWVS
jgi:hypothetical protein